MTIWRRVTIDAEPCQKCGCVRPVLFREWRISIDWGGRQRRDMVNRRMCLLCIATWEGLIQPMEGTN